LLAFSLGHTDWERLMARSAALMVTAILLGAICGFADHALAQQQFAAMTTDSQAHTYFGWGSTREKANAAALRTCRRVSKTCAVPPGSTGRLDDIFALMCCANPRFACAVYPAETREKARELVTGVFVNAHFSKCATKGYYLARTGNRL
jgi:hypothetical protein